MNITQSLFDINEITPESLRTAADKLETLSGFDSFGIDGSDGEYFIVGRRPETVVEIKERKRLADEQKNYYKNYYTTKEKQLIEDFLKLHPGATTKNEKTVLKYVDRTLNISETKEQRQALLNAIIEPYNIQFYDAKNNRIPWNHPSNIEAQV